MRPPGRDVQDLAAGGGEHGAEQSPVAGRVLDPDGRLRRVVLVQPGEQALRTGDAVRDREAAEACAALIEQRDRVALLMDIDTDDHGCPPRSWVRSRDGPASDTTVLVRFIADATLLSSHQRRARPRPAADRSNAGQPRSQRQHVRFAAAVSFCESGHQTRASLTVQADSIPRV